MIWIDHSYKLWYRCKFNTTGHECPRQFAFLLADNYNLETIWIEMIEYFQHCPLYTGHQWKKLHMTYFNFFYGHFLVALILPMILDKLDKVVPHNL